jgi:PIN domain nuclease of toxin-antitoxin system
MDCSARRAALLHARVSPNFLMLGDRACELFNNVTPTKAL